MKTNKSNLGLIAILIVLLINVVYHGAKNDWFKPKKNEMSLEEKKKMIERFKLNEKKN